MLLILELDEVLVGTEARREAAALAAGLYLERVCCVDDGRRLVNVTHADQMWYQGGFDDFQDLTAGLVLWFMSCLGPTLRPKPARVSRAEEVQRAFRPLGLRYGELLAHSERPMDSLLEASLERGGGYDGMLSALRRDTIAGYILRQRTPSAGGFEANVIGQCFYEAYLGSARFESLHAPVRFATDMPGTFHQERPLVSLEDIEKLALQSHLVLASPRPHAMVHWTLERLGIASLFEACITADDAPQAGPGAQGDGWTLREALRQATQAVAEPWPAEQTFAVGNRTDFMAAACQQGVQAIGMARLRQDHKRLSKAGARAVLRRLSTLGRVIEKLQASEYPPG